MKMNLKGGQKRPDSLGGGTEPQHNGSLGESPVRHASALSREDQERHVGIVKLSEAGKSKAADSSFEREAKQTSSVSLGSGSRSIESGEHRVKREPVAYRPTSTDAARWSSSQARGSHRSSSRENDRPTGTDTTRSSSQALGPFSRKG